MTPGGEVAAETRSVFTRRIVEWGPALLVALVAVVTTWPIPAGEMPLSGDHSVHLTRIWMLGEELAHGQIRGWSPHWFVGTPVGELYPVVGDLVIFVMHAASMGLLSLAQAYTLGFTVGFVASGWALLRAFRAMGSGRIPGLVAALMFVTDAGAHREGGWIYTVGYGVWLQPLATALSWLGFGLVVSALAADAVRPRRTLMWASFALAASLLVHPMSLLTVAIGAVVLVLAVPGWSDHRMRGRAIVFTSVALALALGLAWWWLEPMLRHRAWMASYGWLHDPLEVLLPRAFSGELAENMPAAVGGMVWVGLLIAALKGSRPVRFFAALTVVLWVMQSVDAFWHLRLDHVSEGFTHIQYQRFVIAAKPGLYALAGLAVTEVVQLGTRHVTGRAPRPSKTIGYALWATAGVLVVSMLAAHSTQRRDHNADRVQLTRAGAGPAYDEPYRRVVEWLAERRATESEFYRVCFTTATDAHWYMDAPVLTQTALYNLGFTPGDNFVHKPRSTSGEVLDRLRVRYLVAIEDVPPPNTTEVARFGEIGIFERESWRHPLAWLDGPGTVEVQEYDPDRGHVRMSVAGTRAPTRLHLSIAAYPRWVLAADGRPVEWEESPIVGTAEPASPSRREAGEFRGGKAFGEDGTEPTLLSAEVGDGEVTATYVRWTAGDVLAALVSVIGFGLTITLGVVGESSPVFGRTGALADRMLVLGRPRVFVALGLLAVLIVLLPRWIRGHARESTQAVGWLLGDRAIDVDGVEAAPVKIDMLVRPAVTVVGNQATASVTWPDVELGESLDGWIGIDDDRAKLPAAGGHRVTVDAFHAGVWHPLLQSVIPHRPGRSILHVPTGELAGQSVDLRTRVETRGERPPVLGFDFDLGH